MLSARLVDSIFVAVDPELFFDIVILIVQAFTPSAVSTALSTVIMNRIISVHIFFFDSVIGILF